MVKVRHIVAMALAFAVAAPPLSAITPKTVRQQREMQAIARDLNRALGTNAAQVEGTPRAAGEVEAEALVGAMNRERSSYGLGPLRMNAKLSLAAGDRINDMFAKRYFDHVSPDGLDPFTWVDKRGYHYTEVGENLAVGYRNTESVVSGWMHSPGHRANILKAGFDEVGVAIAAGSPTRPYSGPTVVALYGTRKS